MKTSQSHQSSENELEGENEEDNVRRGVEQKGREAEMEPHSFCWLWKLTRPSTVVKVKRRSIESSRINLEIVNQATSVRSNEGDEKVSFELDLPS